MDFILLLLFRICQYIFQNLKERNLYFTIYWFHFQVDHASLCKTLIWEKSLTTHRLHAKNSWLSFIFKKAFRLPSRVTTQTCPKFGTEGLWQVVKQLVYSFICETYFSFRTSKIHPLLSPPYTHNIIVNNIESIKLKVTFLATNCTKILINI